jgi:hypothetical protein
MPAFAGALLRLYYDRQTIVAISGYVLWLCLFPASALTSLFLPNFRCIDTTVGIKHRATATMRLRAGSGPVEPAADQQTGQSTQNDSELIDSRIERGIAVNSPVRKGEICCRGEIDRKKETIFWLRLALLRVVQPGKDHAIILLCIRYIHL